MSESATVGDGPVARGARAAAQRLAPGPGGSLTADVEAALHNHASAHPAQYLDPISLGALIVAVANLVWTIYTDLKTKTPHPSPQVIATRIRIELNDSAPIEPTERNRVIDVVVTETIQAIDEPKH
jgi:hypothetical protein